jgi:predicted PurR-regulated permease PerM
VLTMTFIPFLTYFMLTWGEHARRATVGLFNEEHRRVAYKTLGKIAEMMRGFIIGNFYIGLFISAISVVIFGLIGLPYFYFTGVISGFLSVVPYLGVLLALVPPIATGLGHLTVSHLIAIFVTVLGLHLISMNVLYPKLLGKRMDLNPLVVTLSLLIWGWIWGAMGLLLAVPITASIKIICDNVEQLKPIGAWMGE